MTGSARGQMSPMCPGDAGCGDSDRQANVDAALWEVRSARRALRVLAPAGLDRLWGRLAPHIPAVALDTPPSRSPRATCDAAEVAHIPAGAPIGDVRRWLNAHLHCFHLGHDTLAVHGVALERDGRGVVLLGGHGAGKSLVGIALVRLGWSVVAGDVALVDLSSARCPSAGELMSPPGAPMLVGGTAAFLVRPAQTLRCFPDLPIEDTLQERVELRHHLRSVGRPSASSEAGPAAGWPLRALVIIAGVELDPTAETASVTEAPAGHVAVTQLYAAGGHLLDRVLEQSDYPLRRLETHLLARRRLRVTRRLAASVPMRVAYGAPRRLAALIGAMT